MSTPTRKDIEWMNQNKEGVFQIWCAGYEQGASMRWPEMVFWIALVMFLLNLAMGGE